MWCHLCEAHYPSPPSNPLHSFGIFFFFNPPFLLPAQLSSFTRRHYVKVALCPGPLTFTSNCLDIAFAEVNGVMWLLECQIRQILIVVARSFSPPSLPLFNSFSVIHSLPLNLSSPLSDKHTHTGPSAWCLRIARQGYADFASLVRCVHSSIRFCRGFVQGNECWGERKDKQTHMKMIDMQGSVTNALTDNWELRHSSSSHRVSILIWLYFTGHVFYRRRKHYRWLLTAALLCVALFLPFFFANMFCFFLSF